MVRLVPELLITLIMKVLIVYDSVFGNTRIIAEAIAAGIEKCESEVLHVDNAEPAILTGTDLLIIGSPTIKYKPTPGITRFLEAIPDNSIDEMAVAVFDTRMPAETIKKKIFHFMSEAGGFAANSIADILRKKGAVLILPPEGFVVEGEQGPLKEGEAERATTWAGLACHA